MGFHFDYFPGDLGDSRLNMYFLEHGYLFLTGCIEEYWNAPFMFPEPDVISYSDNLLGIVPFYSFFRLFGIGVIEAFQALVILVFLLNYITAYFFLYDVFKNKFAALGGAMIFAFSIALESQMGHAQTFPRFCIPLIFWGAWCFVKDFEPRFFFLMLLSWVWQLYCGIYLAILVLMPLAIFILGFFIFRYKLLFQELRRLKWLASILFALVLNVFLALLLLDPYLKRSKQNLLPPFEEVFFTIPKPESWLFSKTGSLAWGMFERIGKDIPAYYDHQIFPGGIAFVSVIVVIYLLLKNKLKFRKRVCWIFVTGVISFFVFLRIGEFSFYKWMNSLPGYSALRAIHRIIGIQILFFGFAVSILLITILKRIPKHKYITVIAFMGFFFTDNYVNPSKTYRHSKKEAQKRVEILVNKMSHLESNTVVSYEPEEVDNPIALQLDAMLASQQLNLRCINAYTATSPGTYTRYCLNLTKEGRMEWLESIGHGSEEIIIIK